MNDSRLSFDSVTAMVLVALLATVAGVIAWRRRLALPPASRVLAAAGLVLLVLAAGRPQWRRAIAAEVAVLIDLSPSTRSAGFRDPQTVANRIKPLLGQTPYRLYGFADDTPTPLALDGWSERPVPATRLDPPPAAALLLLSDGRFPLPASAPPTYALIDPTLARASDGRVQALNLDSTHFLATVAADTARSLTWVGGPSGTTVPVPPGRVVLRHPASQDTTTTAKLSPGDLWPENDALTIAPPPPANRQRWFVTTGPTSPAGYVRVSPQDLPTAIADYLAASVIVLDNLPASALPAGVQDRLAQFVRDLGGGVVLVGGAQAFGAGGYVGTTLDAISPLVSAPPRPSTAWILLTDGSGSMNSSAGTAGGEARTRWQSAASALVRLVPAIPADDPVTLGHFAADVNWWTSGRPAGEVRGLTLPPAGVSPGGPTNLRPAIEAAARQHDPSMPGRLLLLSDADADLGDVPSLVDLLRSRNVTLHLLAVGEGKALPSLREVVSQTGGTVVRQDDADRWADAAADLLRSAGDRRLVTTPTPVRFVDRLSTLPGRPVAPWNRTWIRPRATLLAEARNATADRDDTPPLAAVWSLGEGQVAAIAFTAGDAERTALADLVAAVPRDPRFNLTVTSTGQFRVTVDAVERQPDGSSRYLNGLPLTLSFATESATALGPGQSIRLGAPSYDIPQVAPGRYELQVTAPSQSAIATVRNGERMIDRFAVAGRYPEEFDAIGIDRDRLKQMVERFGGAIIEPDDTRPIDFRWARQSTDSTPWFAAAGATLLAVALLWWRWA